MILKKLLLFEQIQGNCVSSIDADGKRRKPHSKLFQALQSYYGGNEFLVVVGNGTIIAVCLAVNFKTMFSAFSKR